MLIRWKRSLALALGLLVSPAWAQDAGWRVPPHGGSAPVQVNPPAVTLGRPTSADQTPCPGPAAASATLGKPVPAGTGGAAAPEALLDGQVQPTGFSKGTTSWPTVRAAGADEEEVQPAVSPTPARSGPITPSFTWTPVADEVAPPPRANGPANPPPPRVAEFFPPVQAVPGIGGAPAPAYGGAPVPAFGAVPGTAFGGPPAPAVVDGASLGATGAYPGNELYVKAEALLWWTKGAAVPALGTSFAGVPTATSGVPGSPGTSVVLGNNHFADTYRGGVRIMAGYWFDDDHLCGVEGGFFILGKTTQNQSFSSTGPINLAIPFINAATGAAAAFPIAGTNNNPFAPGLAGPDAGTLHLQYTSSLFGYETNSRGVCCCGPCGFIDGLVGFRGLGLDENLNLNATTSATSLGGGPLGTTQRSIGDNFAVQNRFYGAQIGTVMEARRGCWVLDLTAKVALGVTQEVATLTGSTVDLRTGAGNMAYANTGFYVQPSNAGRHVQSDFAVVPEVGLTLGYQFTSRLRGFVGYNFLYWSRVVRPADLISPSINPAQFPAVGGVAMGPGAPAAPLFAFHTTDFWAQGITFGVEWRY